MTPRNDPNKKIKIMRTRDNKKVRPNASSRQDPFNDLGGNMRSSLDFTFSTNLEWLSLNWRKYRAALMSLSIRRMILKMYEMDYQYLPSLQEILDGLIKGQNRDLDKNKDQWQDIS